jgi:hypothetical protein
MKERVFTFRLRLKIKTRYFYEKGSTGLCPLAGLGRAQGFRRAGFYVVIRRACVTIDILFKRSEKI